MTLNDPLAPDAQNMEDTLLSDDNIRAAKPDNHDEVDLVDDVRGDTMENENESLKTESVDASNQKGA